MRKPSSVCVAWTSVACLVACLFASTPRVHGQECGEVTQVELICTDDDGVYDVTIAVSSFASADIVNAFLIPTGSEVFAPDNFVFDPPLPPGAGGSLSTTVSGVMPGTTLCFSLTIHDATLDFCCELPICVDVPSCTGEPEFVRGDCNADGANNIADAITGLGILFSGAGPAPCDDACDANDDGLFNIADMIYLLASLFSSGPAPPPPYPTCGVDPTPDPLGCASFPPCP